MAENSKEQVNNTGKKTGVRIAAVLFMIAALLFSVWFMQKYMCIPFSDDEIRVINFHKEPKDSIDVLLIGSSATYSDFASAYAYEKYGYTSFPYAIGGATSTMWKPALKDALCSQKPKLVVVDVFGGGYDGDMIDSRNNQLSIVMSHTPFSAEKIETAKEFGEIVDNSSASGFLFPFIKYHNNVPNCIRDLPDRLRLEFAGPSPLKGVSTMTRARQLADVDPSSFSDESMPLDDKSEAVIRDFIAYCKSQDVKVLFVKYPSVLTDNNPDELEVNLRANRILEIAAEEGCDTLNMQKHFHDVGLKEREDFYNHGHTNTRGQKKVTDYLGKHIQETLGIGPSELSESEKAEWDEAVRYWEAYQAMCEEGIAADTAENLVDCPDLVKRISGLVK